MGCSLCNKGSFAVNDPSASKPPLLNCMLCPIGFFASGTDAIGGCTPCAKGLTTMGLGSSSASQCTCPPGTGRDPVSLRCIGCSIYQYQSADGKTCNSCPDPNMMTLGNALSIRDCLCRPGYARISQSVCALCPIGTFSSSVSGSNRCTPCMPGQTTAGVGSNSFSMCLCDSKQGFQKGSGGLCLNATAQLKSTTTAVVH